MYGFDVLTVDMTSLYVEVFALVYVAIALVSYIYRDKGNAVELVEAVELEEIPYGVFQSVVKGFEVPSRRDDLRKWFKQNDLNLVFYKKTGIRPGSANKALLHEVAMQLV